MLGTNSAHKLLGAKEHTRGQGKVRQQGIPDDNSVMQDLGGPGQGGVVLVTRRFKC